MYEESDLLKLDVHFAICSAHLETYYEWKVEDHSKVLLLEEFLLYFLQDIVTVKIVTKLNILLKSLTNEAWYIVNFTLNVINLWI